MAFAVGATFARRYVVSEAVYEGFLATFGDRNPLHTDEDFARAKGFAGRVMHGNILAGFLSHFVGEGLPTREVVLHKQEIRFRRPVYLGDALDFEATVAHHSAGARALELAFVFANAAGEKVATGRLQVGLL